MQHQKNKVRINNFNLLGCNIANSASPFLHNKIFTAKNLQNSNHYGLLDVAPKNFKQVFSKLNKFSGVNITTPFKVRAFNMLKLKSPEANFFGCVNTIKTLPNGELKGFCTDGFGFFKSLQKFKTLFFKNVLIVGFGGAGKVVLKCLESRCENLFVAVRNLNSIEKPTQTKAKFIDLEQLNGSYNKLNELEFGLVVNATTCGNSLSQNCAPINLDCLGKIDAAFDLIYYPTTTKFLKQAHKLGAETLNGVDMLVWQAVAAQQIWNGLRFKTKFVENLIQETKKFLESKQKAND